MIAKGSNGLKAYVGSTGVDKMYLGDTLVYSSTPPSPPDYLCFTALANGSFTLNIGSLITTEQLPSVSYSLDGGETWVSTPNQDDVSVNVTTPTINAGDSVLWKANGVVCTSSAANKYSRFSSTGNFEVSGSLNTMLFGDTPSKGAKGGVDFFGLFMSCTKLIYADALVLPVNPSNHCFYRLFRGCTNLITGPDLSKVISTPRNCYQEMFYGCSKLKYDVSINDSKPGVQGYMNMFYNCKLLSYIKMLATDISASNCLLNWVTNVASAGIFVKHIDATWTTTGNGGVPTNWTVLYYDPDTDKYYLSDKVTECDDHGNVV